MEVEEGQRISLTGLPAACIKRALSLLGSPKDILGFDATCRQFWALGRLAETCAPSLEQRCGLSLKVRAFFAVWNTTSFEGEVWATSGTFDTLAKTYEVMLA